MHLIPDLKKNVGDLHALLFRREFGVFGFIFAFCIIVSLIIGSIFSFFILKNKAFPSKTQSETLGAAITQTPISASTATSIPTAIPTLDPCKENVFSDQLWNTSFYHKDAEGYYLPYESAISKYPYPPMSYKDKMPGVFKKIHIAYEANYQTLNSTTSATLYVALYDPHKKKAFEINAPEPNRQLILLHTQTPVVTPPAATPTHTPPIHLLKPIRYDGTHEITIESIQLHDSLVTYKVSGKFIDTAGNPQVYVGEIHAQLDTVVPSVKDFILVVATGQKGKLKIKQISVCD